ncbi:hypothetical protein K443DRAFT_639808 [Laccaria amethystina LaAM-08-1]|uniref:Unplaced genomic scaffold K443scaffold_234, whole genome shotgun sequence n=1 Tax=Laccaria amethystina LaAM-08-1 TaxID=1095629 RepID=A0A0C9X199_9AGAR|nr:hypothetical protein K443DRAFT_639808 [Laccaria amethystina LaAM-08-1]
MGAGVMKGASVSKRIQKGAVRDWLEDIGWMGVLATVSTKLSVPAQFTGKISPIRTFNHDRLTPGMGHLSRCNREKGSLEYGTSKRVHLRLRRERQFRGWIAESAHLFRGPWLWVGEASLGIERAYGRRILDRRIQVDFLVSVRPTIFKKND